MIQKFIMITIKWCSSIHLTDAFIYNKNKDEAVSQEILAGANIVGEDQTTKPTEKLVVMLDNDVNTVVTEDDSAVSNLDE